MGGIVLTGGAHTFIGQTFERNTTPGGNTVYLIEGDGSVFKDCTIVPSPTAGIMFSGQPKDGKHGPLVFLDTDIPGSFNPHVHDDDNRDPTPSKWGVMPYLAKGFAWVGGNVFGFEAWNGEHCFYPHNTIGDFLLHGLTMRWAGRTALQDANRRWEGDEEKPAGQGKRMVVGCSIEDVCLQAQGGGSALTFKGGAPTSDILIKNTKVSLGCTPGLKPKWQPNITGSLVVEEKSGFGLNYGYRSLKVEGCEFRVGEVYPGVGSARRTNVMIDNVQWVHFRDVAIWQGQDAVKRSLEIGPQVKAVAFRGEIDIRGEIVVKGTTYKNSDDLKARRPELFDAD